jgi:methylenetetrahydrofolate reductase (NADPH)
MIWSAYARQLEAPVDDFLVAVNGFSIEIGVSELESFKQFEHLLPKNTEVFLNEMPKDKIGERVAICKLIRSRGMRPIPHIASRKIRRKSDVQPTLERFIQEGEVETCLIVGGDYSKPGGEVEDAVDLIRQIGNSNSHIRRLGITGYPEGHPQISDEKLQAAHKEKISVLRSLGIEPFVVTQFSFDGDAIVDYCEKFHAEFPDIELKAGVPSPAKLTTLIRFAQRCGVAASIKKLKGLPVATSLKLMQRVPPINQALAVGKYRDEHNANTKLQFFTFGGLEASLEWIRGEVTDRMAAS